MGQLEEYEEIKELYSKFLLENKGLETENPEFVDLMDKNERRLNKYFAE
jgi:hypothetical protein